MTSKISEGTASHAVSMHADVPTPNVFPAKWLLTDIWVVRALCKVQSVAFRGSQVCSPGKALSMHVTLMPLARITSAGVRRRARCCFKRGVKEMAERLPCACVQPSNPGRTCRKAGRKRDRSHAAHSTSSR